MVLTDDINNMINVTTHLIQKLTILKTDVPAFLEYVDFLSKRINMSYTASPKDSLTLFFDKNRVNIQFGDTNFISHLRDFIISIDLKIGSMVFRTRHLYNLSTVSTVRELRDYTTLSTELIWKSLINEYYKSEKQKKYNPTTWYGDNDYVYRFPK